MKIAVRSSSLTKDASVSSAWSLQKIPDISSSFSFKEADIGFSSSFTSAGLTSSCFTKAGVSTTGLLTVTSLGCSGVFTSLFTGEGVFSTVFTTSVTVVGASSLLIFTFK